MNRTLGTFSEQTLDYVARLARGVSADGTIVEIGAYYGRVTQTLAENAAPGVRILAFQSRRPFFEHAGKAIYGTGDAASVARYDFNLLAENTCDLDSVTVFLERSPPPFAWPAPWAPSLVLLDISSRIEIITENAIYWVPSLAPDGRFVVVSPKFLRRDGGIEAVMSALREGLGGPYQPTARVEEDRYFIIERMPLRPAP